MPAREARPPRRPRIKVLIEPTFGSPPSSVHHDVNQVPPSAPTAAAPPEFLRHQLRAWMEHQGEDDLRLHRPDLPRHRRGPPLLWLAGARCQGVRLFGGNVIRYSRLDYIPQAPSFDREMSLIMLVLILRAPVSTSRRSSPRDARGLPLLVGGPQPWRRAAVPSPRARDAPAAC